MQRLTADRLRELLHYDPETGVFRWRIDIRCGRGMGYVKFPAGSLAGSAGLRYWFIGIEGEKFYAHRLAWLYMTGEWPSATVDHWDRDGFNNKWDNLRDATIAQQRQNMTMPRTNKSGMKGVCWCKDKRKWLAQIGVNGTHRYIGRFDTVEEAGAAYAAKKAELHAFHPHV